MYRHPSIRIPRNTSVAAKPNQPGGRYRMAGGQRDLSANPARRPNGAGAAQLPQRGDQLIALLAETEDDAGLGEQRRRRRTRAPEQLERALVAPAVARDLVEPRDGLRIMVQDVGPGVDHGLERAGRALEIRNQHLDLATRPLPAD